MKQFTTLAWKEWAEARIYLWIGLGVFLGLPMIGGLEECLRASHRFEIDVSVFVIGFGGVLAIFVAVGSTCRDLTGKVQDFWRSTPVGVARWLLTKYVIGLVIVLFACTVPLLAQTWIDRLSPPADVLEPLKFLLFFWTALYSVAFAAGCLLRRNAQAAVMALAAMLLFILLPLILPPLSWLDFSDFRDSDFWEKRQVGFAITMLALSVISITVAIIAVQRSWRIPSGAKLIYGSIAAVVVILCASASFQLGTTMPVLQEIDIPKGRTIDQISAGENGCYVSGSQYDRNGKPQAYYQKVEVTSAGVTLAPVHIFGPEASINVSRADARLPDGTQVRYSASSGPAPDPGKPWPPTKLQAFINRNGIALPMTDFSLKLWDNKLNTVMNAGPCYAWNQTLYVPGMEWQRDEARQTWNAISARLATVDISHPLEPRLLSSVAGSYRLFHMSDDRKTITLHLLNLPGVPLRERLKFTLDCFCSNSSPDGETVCDSGDKAMVGYRLVELTDSQATYVKTGEHRSSILENLFGHSFDNRLQLSNGLVYQARRQGNGLRPMISVFDITGAYPMRMVGHFAAPGVKTFALLPDGRALVAGEKLWLVGPPPKSVD